MLTKFIFFDNKSTFLKIRYINLFKLKKILNNITAFPFNYQSRKKIYFES